MSAFHRVDDVLTLPAPLYFARALRLGAYQGVLQARAIEEKQREEGGIPATPGSHERPVEVSDSVALSKLANEGWLDHKQGGAA